MSKHVLFLTIALMLLAWPATAAATTIFLSDSNTNPSISNPSLSLPGLGSVDSLFVWVIPDAGETVNGMGLRVSTTTPGVIEFTQHEVFNPHFALLIQDRWNALNPGVQSGSLIESNAVSVIGTTGLNASLGAAGAPGYDVITGGYLHSRIDLQAVGAGTTDIELAVGSNKITVSGQAEAELVTFGSGDAQVSGSAPGSSGLLADASVTVGLAGDLDGDGFVGITDLNIVLGAWNQTVPPADPLADPTGDGFIGIEDLNTVLGNWNAGSPPAAAVPEPGALTCLMMLCAVPVMKVRCRVTRTRYRRARR